MQSVPGNEKFTQRHPWSRWFTGADAGQRAVIGRRMSFRRGVDFLGRTDTFLAALRNKATAYGVGLQIVVSHTGEEITAFIRERGKPGRRPTNGGN